VLLFGVALDWFGGTARLTAWVLAFGVGAIAYLVGSIAGLFLRKIRSGSAWFIERCALTPPTLAACPLAADLGEHVRSGDGRDEIVPPWGECRSRARWHFPNSPSVKA
jgi:hypothetical protein